MTIATGDRLPDVTIKTNGPKGPEDLATGDFFAGRRVVEYLGVDTQKGVIEASSSDTILAQLKG